MPLSLRAGRLWGNNFVTSSLLLWLCSQGFLYRPTVLPPNTPIELREGTTTFLWKFLRVKIQVNVQNYGLYGFICWHVFNVGDVFILQTEVIQKVVYNRVDIIRGGHSFPKAQQVILVL